MYIRRILRFIILTGIIVCMLNLAACNEPVKEVTVPVEEEIIKIAPGAYDSADKAIVVAKQEEQKKITFFNLEKRRNYTLNYDGITKFMDKYGTQISVSQLEEGEMVELLFLKDEKSLSSLTISSDIWTLNDVTKFELDMNAGRMKIMDEYYTLDESTVVLSEGVLKEIMDINQQDILQIKGMDHKIYSIVVEEGHGYLRLINDEYFVGGWIEVGQKIIQKIEDDMLLVVPEGNYEVYLSHSGIEGAKEVKITRNKETTLDVGDLKKDDLIKYGNLIFTVEPSTAQVSIDGKKVDISRVVKAEYGLHQIMAKAEGYETVIQYIRVNENNANVSITLDEETERTVSENKISSDTTTSNTTNTNSTSNTTASSQKENSTENNTTNDKTDSKKDENNSSDTTENSNVSVAGYKVSIEAPEGAEVYVDGNYVGIAPVSYKKKSGTQEVTIRKSGYVTRSYTINVDDEPKDVSYSFSELTAIQ